ncbi:hypothetical protein CK203_035423 [Vitis vinifera]|uniref:Uncharacterized protein n=1 Tax=Vitis vinifera TaxID=29760 RepID=A0A438I3K6_VITVI|nr:hypothetical protein CK203_035423 [Vitis vinifera]
MDFTESDDHIHMLSWDDYESESIVVDKSYEVDGVISNSQAFAPFRLVLDMTPLQLTMVGSLIHPCSHLLLESFGLIYLPLRGTGRALSQIRVETSTSSKGLIHMLTADRATYIVLSADDLPPRATTVALGFKPSDFEPSSQTVQAYHSTCRDVLGRLWILRVKAISSSLHQKVKFIHEGRVITIQSTRDSYSTFKPVLEISHGGDDLFLIGFTFDEIQTMEVEQFCRDHMRLLLMSMFIATVDHDTPFRLGFILNEVDYRYMARLHKERVMVRLTHTPFYYPVCPYTMSLADYFVRAPKLQTHLDGIIGAFNTA